MNFFSYQDQARRNTVWLVVLFTVGVVLTIAALYVAVTLILVFVGGWEPASPAGFFSPGLLLAVAGLTVGIIAFGSGSKYLSLRGGGRAVAENLGGKPIPHDTDDLNERRLLNVVEEMAIASGTPVPPVYVLEEEGINAFAAGHSMNDAVIGVTRGCLEALNRDELQGVIAHEFSHIVNEDVRLNLRLMAIIAGLIMISVIGRQMLYSFRYAAIGRSRSRNGKGGKGQLAILLIALAFLVIGALGVLCSRMIKAAISRQREYLADASAVQFTRNPKGLAGALQKIRDRSARITHPRAEEASHMFFSDALTRSFSSKMLSTHPPLAKRIQRLDPSYEPRGEELPATPAADGPVSQLSGTASGEGAPAEATGTAGSMSLNVDLDAARIRNEVGTLSAERLAYGEQVRERLPESLRRAAHETFSAVALTYALVLDNEPGHRAWQMGLLRERCTPSMLEEIERLGQEVRTLDPWLRLPLAELLLPGLRQLTDEQYERFAPILRQMMLHDEELSIFQFALSKMLLHQLEETYERTRRGRKIKSLAKLEGDIHVVLSALAKADSNDPEARAAALRTGLERLPGYAGPTTLAEESFQQLSEALDRLAMAAPSLKEQIIDACGHVALANETVTLNEAELLRAVAATLDCPLPPFVPRVRVA